MKFSWSSISLETYAQIDGLLRFNATDKLQQEISALAILTGKEEAFFERISLTRLGRYQKALRDLRANPPKEAAYSFSVRGRKFTFEREIENFLGEHLEGISLLKITPENVAENTAKIVAVLVEETESRLLKPLLFKQKVDLFDKYLPASIGIPIRDKFLTDLGEVMKPYESMPQKVESITEGLQPNFGNKVPMFEHYGYFHVFFELSGRDRTKMDYWRNQSIPYILTSLGHRRGMLDEPKEAKA